MTERKDTGAKYSVLVVEDNSINQELMKEMLDRLHCCVDTVANGAAALNQVQSKSYHMIFMDLHMPEMDGFETARQIRRQAERQSSTPIIAITANVTPGVVQQCLDAGMDDYIPKPFQLEDLEALLKKYFPAS